MSDENQQYSKVQSNLIDKLVFGFQYLYTNGKPTARHIVVMLHVPVALRQKTSSVFKPRDQQKQIRMLICRRPQ